ncbi:MAG: hypothetical protein ACOX86_01750 [Pelotomaculaceae bacterium]|jgi:cyanophycin synthetase|nr:hypothetical protein [Bacillota bacterium]HHU85379.1 hypothetical protein [Peptococcaceae bacterium]
MSWPGRINFRDSIFSRVEKTVRESIYNPNVQEQQKDPVPGLAGLKDMAIEAALRAGYRVVNADGRRFKNSSGEQDGIVIYYSSASDNMLVRRHLGAGGLAVFVQDGKILAASGCGVRIIADAGGGSPADLSELDDALAAAAGLLALGILP